LLCNISNDSCREVFKILQILPLPAQSIYSKTMCVVNNREYFMENSELYDSKTRNNKNLLQPQSNLFIYQRSPHYAGIKIYNNLPTQIKLLSSNFNQFKKVLKNFLELHTFHTSAEYVYYIME
jgi:hypothetical protein